MLKTNDTLVGLGYQISKGLVLRIDCLSGWIISPCLAAQQLCLHTRVIKGKPHHLLSKLAVLIQVDGIVRLIHQLLLRGQFPVPANCLVKKRNDVLRTVLRTSR